MGVRSESQPYRQETALGTQTQMRAGARPVLSHMAVFQTQSVLDQGRILHKSLASFTTEGFTFVIPALGRQRQLYLCEIEA